MLKKLIRKIKSRYYSKVKKMDGSDIAIMEMRKKGIRIGNDCRVFSNISSKEPSLITIGDRVTISSGVIFCTHDNGIIKAIPGKTDVVGPITIGDDCFLGMRSILMYGITLGDHCIVGAGSVVTKSFPPRSVIGGNPAKLICTIDEYAEKYSEFAVDFSKIPLDSRAKYFKDHPEKLIKR